jgi:CubicO group peptidase (beta-lactamase class C family)
VRAALSHSAGLPREGGTPYWVEIDFPTREVLLNGLTDQERLYTPQDTWQYSNLGMAMLGEAVARVSGQDFDSYVQGAILDPLALEGVTTDLPNDEHGARFAVGYYMHDAQGNRAPLEPYSINGIVPAAGFAASVEDLARFASWQFALLETGEGGVLDRQSLREMHRVQWADPNDPDSPMWGLGFQNSRLNGDAVVGHGGYCPGYRADLRLRLPDQIAVTAMVNTNDVAPSMLSAGLYAITKSALTADEPPAELEFAEYEGVFGREGFTRQEYVLPTADGLMLVPLFSASPMENAATLEHVEGDVFRRKRDEDGRVIRFWRHGNYAPRLDG